MIWHLIALCLALATGTPSLKGARACVPASKASRPAPAQTIQMPPMTVLGD